MGTPLGYFHFNQWIFCKILAKSQKPLVIFFKPVIIVFLTSDLFSLTTGLNQWFLGPVFSHGRTQSLSTVEPKYLHKYLSERLSKKGDPHSKYFRPNFFVWLEYGS